MPAGDSDCGLPPNPAAQVASLTHGSAADRCWTDPAWKARLKSANDAAIAAGVFSAPFFMIDGEPFWGNDRRPQIERWLEKGPF